MLLARNAAFNFLGAAAPALLTLLTLPYIVATLGVADFGMLALVTAIVGSFALLDINITAGSTKYVAQFQASGLRDELHRTATFGFAFYAGIGLIGMAALLVYADVLVARVFSVPPERQAVAAEAVRVAALGFLVGQVQLYLHSLPGALMRYDVSGSIEAVFGCALPLATVALLALGFGLVGVVWLRVGASLLQAGVLAWWIARLLPGFRPAWPAAPLRRSLLSFSAWAFMSRIAALTYVHADKLVIGARIGVASLAYYVVPSTLVNRAMTMVGRLSGVMFPHASAMEAAQRLADLRRHYLLAARYLFFVNGAIAVALAGLAEPLLALWLSPEFARQGALVLVLIALAQWADSTTHLPTLVNDGLGHPRVSGAFAIARAVTGLVLIAVAVGPFGIAGAAAAHLVAALLAGGAFLVAVHGRTVPVPLRALLGTLAMPVVALLPVAAAAFGLAHWAADGWASLVAAGAVVAGVAAVAAWALVLGPAHRALVRRRVLMPRGGGAGGGP